MECSRSASDAARSWHRKRIWCRRFTPLFLTYPKLSEFDQLTSCAEREGERDEPSVIPLICSACVWEHPRIDVGAQAALGEHADSALTSKNRLNEEKEKKWLNWMASMEEENLSTMLEPQPKNGLSWRHCNWKWLLLSSVCFIWASMWGKTRKLLQFRFPSLPI